MEQGGGGEEAIYGICAGGSAPPTNDKLANLRRRRRSGGSCRLAHPIGTFTTHLHGSFRLEKRLSDEDFRKREVDD